MSSIISIENEILLKAGFNSNMERPVMQPTNEIDLSNSGEVLPDNVVNWDALNINIFEEGMDLQSADFITGNSGWRIRGDGIAEFQAITITGAITATSGDIGGWTVGETTLHSTGNEIVLDSDNKKIVVGSDSSIILDGTNKRIEVGTANKIFIDGENKRIQSDNYVSGAFGSGFHLSDNLLEVGNIACRGLIRTAVFQKDVVNVMGGNFAVLDGDVLDEDMTADDNSTLKTKGTTNFAVGDILRIKDGTDDEWLEVLENICDSYSESNQDGYQGMSAGRPVRVGQSFTGDGQKIGSCKFYLKKACSPTGNAVAKIYAHTGTFGTDGIPTGVALATSDNFDVSTLTADFQLITFNFIGTNKIQLVSGTHYFVVLEYSGGGGINQILIGGDYSSPTHSGNYCQQYDGSSWVEAKEWDNCFYVHTEVNSPYSVSRDKKGDYDSNDNPIWKKGATVVNYKQSGDGGVYMTASENNAPYLSVFTHGGEPWTDLSTKLRIGNLNGYLGYATDKYGIGIGETNKYLKYDPTNGLRIKGDIEATSGKFGTATNYWSVGAKGLTAVSASTDVIINYGKTDFGQDTTNGFILGYDYSASKSKFEIGSSASKIFKYDGTNISLVGGIITAGTVRTSSGNPRIQLSGANNRMEIYNSDGTIIGYFGDMGNGNLMYGNLVSDYPAVWMTSSGNTNMFNLFNTNSSNSHPVFRVESNNSNAEVMYLKQTGDYNCLIAEGGSSACGVLYVTQNGNGHVIDTNKSAYLSNGGVWIDNSSKKCKENFKDITVLDRIKGLDIKEYNYIAEKRQSKNDVRNWLKERKQKQKYSQTDEGRKSGSNDKRYLKEKITTKENEEIEKELVKEYARELKRPVPKHFSPMAEDFNAMFGLGDDKGISAKDVASIALQAIKELTLKVEKLENNLIK